MTTIRNSPVPWMGCRHGEWRVWRISSEGGHTGSRVTGPGGSDSLLAERIANRDESALEELFREYGGAVKSVAVRVLRDANLAEDVVQETFTALWNSPEKFNSQRGSLRAFLFTIAHRRAVDTVRSEVARSRREQRPPDPEHFDLEDEVWSREISATVRRALQELPAAEREAITLAYFADLSYSEVARRLGQPEGTVKSRIRSAMRKLSVALAEIET